METLTGNREELDRKAAGIVADAINRLAPTQAQIVLGVVGGRSVGGIYEHLKTADVPWSQVHVFLADERLVPVTSDESNYKLVKHDLLADLIADNKMPDANAHAFILDESKDDFGVSGYTADLDSIGGKFDVLILSAGEDGHTASLFPNHPSVENESDGFILVENSPKPPPKRISASRHLLDRASTGLMVFYDDAKQDALDKFRDPAVDVLECPSKLVITLPEAYVITNL